MRNQLYHSYSQTYNKFEKELMKISVFWDVTPCSLVEVHQRFGVTDRFHFQSQRMNLASNQLCFLPTSFYSLGLLLDTENGSSMFVRNGSEHLPEYRASSPEDSVAHRYRCDNLKSKRITTIVTGYHIIIMGSVDSRNNRNARAFTYNGVVSLFHWMVLAAKMKERYFVPTRCSKTVYIRGDC
jgi:hypothetical protein